MSKPSDDFKLLTECTRGKREAWDIFVKRYSKLVYYSITRTLKSYTNYLPQEDVEDIFNSIFLSFIENNYKKLRQFEARHGCTLSSWVRLISIRYTIDFLRSQRKHISMNDDSNKSRPFIDTLPNNQVSFEEQIESKETESAIKEAIDALPSSDKLFVKLHYEKELSPEEIANIMNISINTVYSKKNRIKEKIKKILKKMEFIARNSE
ncbi:MAG: RNA polymerase sigma factor [Nitrospinota bacterium]